MGGGGEDGVAAAMQGGGGKLRLPLHSIIQEKQARNGLRHSDYGQYRRYCARRLRRLRSARDVRFLLGRGRSFEKGKRMGEEDAKSDRHLEIPLMMAERAWAYSMELKLDGEEGANSSLRHHMKRRMKRAVSHAKELEQLCIATADERTCLEATAYAERMEGTHHLDREEWRSALDHLSTASSLYSDLGRVGSLADQDLFSQQADEIEPSLRYCRYQLQKAAGSDPSLAQELRKLQEAGGAVRDEVLAAMLAKVVSEARQVEASELEYVKWRGRRLRVSSEKLRTALVAAKEASARLKEHSEAPLEESDKGGGGGGDAQSSKVESLHARAFSSYDEVLAIIQGQIVQLEREGSGARALAEKHLARQLHDYASFSKLEIMLNRNSSILGDLINEDQFELADVVHVYDAMLQNVREMRACLERAENVLDGREEEDDVVDADQEEDALDQLLRLEADEARLRAARCFYLAEAYAKDGKWVETATLYDHVAKLCREGRLLAQQVGASADEIDEVASKVAGGLSRAAAKAYVVSKMSSIQALPVSGIVGRLQEFLVGSEQEGFRIADFPPSIRPVTCKPILLDTAHDFLAFPDLRKRATEGQGSSTIGKVFNWAFGRG